MVHRDARGEPTLRFGRCFPTRPGRLRTAPGTPAPTPTTRYGRAPCTSRPPPRDAHADISQQLAELLGATARAAGLIPTIAQSTSAAPTTTASRTAVCTRTWGTYAPSAALILEIVSPGDETRDKLPFYAAHQVDELLIVDPQKRTVDWSAGRFLETPPANGGAVALRAAGGPFGETVSIGVRSLGLV